MPQCIVCQQALPQGKKIDYFAQDDPPIDEIGTLFRMMQALYDAMQCVGVADPSHTPILDKENSLYGLAKLGHDLCEEVQLRLDLYCDFKPQQQEEP